MIKKTNGLAYKESEQPGLAALRSDRGLDTLPEKEFDSLVELAAFSCQAPISLLSLVDEKRQWLKAKAGVDINETGPNISFCPQTLDSNTLFEVPDALENPLFAGHPLVIGAPKVRFYAGVPLVNTEGDALGTLCILDTVPRTLTNEQKNALQTIADQVIINLALRKLKQLAEKGSNQLLQSLHYASNQFLTVADYKKAIKSALPVIGKALGVHYISVYEKVLEEEGSAGCCLQLQWSAANEALMEQADWRNGQVAEAGLERWYKQLKEGEVLQGLVRDFPETEQEILRIQPVKSVLVIPILVSNKFWGFLRFDEGTKNRVWTSTEEHALSTLANTLGSAIARYQAEVVLVNTKNYLDNIINAVPVSLFVKDSQHRFILINDACCELNGASREGMLGKSDYDLFPTEDADVFWKKEDLVFQSGQEHVSEETVIRPNGAITTVITSKAAFKNEYGESYLVGCNLDITERMQAEKALAKEQYWVKAFMDHTPDRIYFKDLQSRFIRVSKSLLSGISGEETNDIIGKTDFDLFLNEHAQKAYDTEQQIIKTGVPLLNFEEQETWPDGKVTWASTNKMPLYDEEGVIIGTFGVSRDITATKQTEIAIVNSKNYLNHIFDTVPIPIFVKDSNHRWIFLNEAWCRFSGVSKGELLGKSDYDLHSREEASLFRERDDVVFRTGQETIHEEVLTNNNGLDHTVITKKTRFRDQYGEDFLVGTMIDITDLKNTQTKLIVYQNYLNTLINAVTDPLFVKDVNHRLILVNDSFCHFTGFSREHLLSKSDYELFSKEEAKVFWHYDEIVFQSKTTSTNEEVIKDSSGTYRIILTKKTHFMNEWNEVFLVGTITDITERKKAEVALVAQEKYYRSLIQYSTDIVSVVGADGKIRYSSPSFYQTTGYSEADVLGSTGFDYIHPEDMEEASLVFSQVLQQPGVPLSGEYRIRKANGDWAVMEVISTNWLDDEAVAGIVVNSRDVTERKRAAAEIHEKSQLLQDILSNMPVVAFKINQHGIYTHSTGAGLKQMGLAENGLNGLNVFDAFPEAKEQVKKAYAEGFASFFNTTTATGVGRHYEVRLFEDKAQQGGLIGFAIDITDNKISEQKLQEYAINLEKINKELDQFAYIVSHDLKAPLRAIANLSQWIEEDLGTGITAEVKSNMALLRSRVNRLQALINGILDYSRVNRTKITYEEVNVDALLKEVIHVLDIPDTHPVTWQTTMPCIIANSIRLDQVFSNLIGNAIKYHDKPSGNIRISYQDTKDFHQFSIADDGPGIEPEYHDKIFVIFQTLQSKDKVESTGVGLAIVKKIIEDQGGKISVESQFGQGSTFIFTLPKQVKNFITTTDYDG